MKYNNREVKWFLGIVIVLLIAVIVGSVYISRTGEAEAKNEALENAFREAKHEMAEEYDDELAENIEIHELIEVADGRNEISYEVILTRPNLTEVYDRLYEGVIDEEVWEEESMEEAVERIYAEALEDASRESMALPEEIRISRQNRGNWRAENPEAFYFVIPQNPTSYIADDLQKIKDFMDFTVVSDELPEGSLEKEVAKTLMDKDFFRDFGFVFTQSSEGDTYRLQVSLKGFYQEEALDDLITEEDFREYRGEIHSQEELVNIIVETMEEEATRTLGIHSLELREYERPTDELFGYELLYRSGYPEDFLGEYIDEEGVFEIRSLYLESLKRYYLSIQIDHVLDRADPAWVEEFSDKNPLQVAVDSDEIAVLFSDNQELVFQTYDFQNGELTGQSVIAEDYPVILYAELEEYKDYEIERHRDYYIVTDQSVRDQWWILQRGEEELFLRSNGALETGGEFVTYTEEFLLENDNVFSIISHEEDDLDGNFTVKVKNHTQDTTEEVYFDERIPGEYFLSPGHGIMLMYPVVDRTEEGGTSEASLTLYDFEKEEIIEPEEFPEELQEANITQVEAINEDRLLVVTGARDFWEFNMVENSFLPSELTEALEPVYETKEERGIHEVRYDFHPMEENYYFLEILGLSSGGMIRDRSMILKDYEGILEAVIEVNHSSEQGRSVLNYEIGNDLLIAAEQSLGEDSRRMDVTLMEISYNALDEIEEVTSLETIEEFIREGYASVLATYEEPIENDGKEHFTISMDSLMNRSFMDFPAGIYYDRETGDLLIESSSGRYSMNGFLRHFKDGGNEAKTPPLWNYDDLYINHEHEWVYYQDERGMLVYELEAFIPALVQERN
ncbi:hypothetical protein [Isachenkonia alkalipeptolytica]|uniref:Uncharacterized protein n=1 Tax=Isachenkonia alkalipeptolytica TaxID=2565777 RepID=A0AA44BCZ2_9CLOT|nr:hypothetical protein [Isachenkonia alkalipeptolytica]NBG87824.1 hypothetical protein [Isachenkonia alkalipeptolytica]